MGKVVCSASTSLDGFVVDPSGSVDRLYPDLASLHGTDYMDALIDETGAVVMGRRAFEMGDPDWYAGNYEFQVPIFVVTHEPPRVAPKQDEHLSFTFVTDGIESAIRQALAAAGDKAVQVVGGISVIQQLLRAGLVDELRVDVMPVLLGGGQRLFPDEGLEGLQLQKTGVQEIGPRTSLRFSIGRSAVRRT